jgi:hypothetical protein
MDNVKDMDTDMEMGTDTDIDMDTDMDIDTGIDTGTPVDTDRDVYMDMDKFLCSLINYIEAIQVLKFHIKNIAVTNKLRLNELKILLLMHLQVVRKITLQQVNSQHESKILLMKHPQMAR